MNIAHKMFSSPPHININSILSETSFSDGEIRFASTGKELDAETGYSYFGARYFDPATLTAWLSVDPMADKYPSISPYAYCAWNPVKLVDPEGKDTAFAGAQERQLYLEYRNIVFSDDKYKAIQSELLQMESAEEMFCIRMGDNTTNEAGSGNFVYNAESRQFDINISADDSWTDIEKISHELKHVDQYLNKQLTFLISPSGKVKADNYSRNDELEAFARQGMFGNTLTTDQIHQRYRNLLFYKQNSVFTPTMEIIDVNNKYYNQFGHPRMIYHGWKNDLSKSK